MHADDITDKNLDIESSLVKLTLHNVVALHVHYADNINQFCDCEHLNFPK
jgi:hypothetical protein